MGDTIDLRCVTVGLVADILHKQRREGRVCALQVRRPYSIPSAGRRQHSPLRLPVKKPFVVRSKRNYLFNIDAIAGNRLYISPLLVREVAPDGIRDEQFGEQPLPRHPAVRRDSRRARITHARCEPRPLHHLYFFCHFVPLLYQILWRRFGVLLVRSLCIEGGVVAGTGGKPRHDG